MPADAEEAAQRCTRRMRPLLGTFVEIGFQPALGAEAAVRAAFSAIEQVERRLSFQDPESELSRLNACTGHFVALSPIAVRVVGLARAMTLASGGLFNCTLAGALIRRGLLPNHDGCEVLDCGTALDIDIVGRRVRLARSFRITLDGIAKGYAVDSAVAALQRGGVKTGWVNAGGDLRVFGALTLPVNRREANGHLAWLGGVRQAALATSAVHARRARRFPGTIVTAAGDKPAAGVWSVLARRAWRADALTKVAALAPDASRHVLLSRLGGRLVEAQQRID